MGLLLQTDIFWTALCVLSTLKVIWVKEYNTECVLCSSHKHQINMNKWGECSSVGFGWVSLSNLLEVKACGLFCCGWIVLSKYVPILLPSCFCVYKTSREYTSYIYNDCLYMKYKLPIYLFFSRFLWPSVYTSIQILTLFDLSKSKITSNLYVVIHNKTQLYCITLSTSVQQSWTLMLYKASKQKMRPPLQQSTIRNKTTCTVLLQFYIKRL